MLRQEEMQQICLECVVFLKNPEVQSQKSAQTSSAVLQKYPGGAETTVPHRPFLSYFNTEVTLTWKSTASSRLWPLFL